MKWPVIFLLMSLKATSQCMYTDEARGEQAGEVGRSIQNHHLKLYFAKRSNVKLIFDKRQDLTIKYEFVTKTRAHAVYMFGSKLVDCS